VHIFVRMRFHYVTQNMLDEIHAEGMIGA
jgi:hypothetical protein